MSLESGYEKVHTVLDYYDGILTGVADYNGNPHFFECIFDKEVEHPMLPMATTTIILLGRLRRR
jgi:hypothetical protein